jgi:glyoxylase-like metal-dependent hydrolase (beta-lactamase superfamily II)
LIQEISTGGARRAVLGQRRKEKWKALSGAFALLLFTSAALALGRRYTVTEVKPHVFVWVPEDIHDIDGDPSFTLAGTSGFIIGTQGVIVINTTNTPFHAREVRYEIRERTDLPVKYVINTGPRGDQILGNEVFSDERATFISTPVAKAEMQAYGQELAKLMEADGEPGLRMRRRMRGIHFTLPNEEINNEMKIGVGGEEVRLLIPLAGPSPGDLVVYLPSSKVLFLGDLYENGYKPQLDGADLAKWTAFLREVETWNVDVYVPGHGAPGDKKSLAEFLNVLESSEKNPKPEEKKSLIRTRPGQLPRTSESGQAPNANGISN